MGDLNQLEIFKRWLLLAKAPVLEIGSKDYGNTPDYRQFFSGKEYTGLDMMEGKGVDIVMDLSDPKAPERLAKKFNTIICFSVLEHCKNLFQMAKNIEAILERGGACYISVPFAWEYHAFPDDYWRFTPQGVKALFPNLDFSDEFTLLSTSNDNEIKPFHSECFKIDLSPRVGVQKKRYGLMDGIIIKLLKSASLLKPVLNNIYLIPPVNVTMVGIKK